MAHGSVAQPGGGTGAGAGSGAGSQPVDYSAISDDQILEQEDGAQDETLELEEGSDSGAADLDATAAETTEGEETQIDGDGEEHVETEVLPVGSEYTAPPEIAALFKDPKVGKSVRETFYRDAAYRELGTVAEIRAVKDLFPGGAEDAQSAAQARTDLAELDELYYSLNPQDTEHFISRLHEEDAGAFTNLAKSFPDVLFKLAPDIYREQTARQVQDTMANVYETAIAQGAGKGQPGENLKNAVDVLSFALFNRPFDKVGRAPQTRQSTEATAREKRVTEREQAIETNSFNTFHGSTNTALVNRCINDIKTTVTKLLDKTPAKGNAKVLNKIVGEVYTEIDGKLKADKGLTESLRREFKAAKLEKYSDAAKARIVNLMAGRAKALLAKSAKNVVQEWTTAVLGNSAARQDKLRTGAARKDVTGGQPSGQRRGPVAARTVDPAKVNYGKTSDDDILNGRVTVRR